MQKIKIALLAVLTVFTFSCSSDDNTTTVVIDDPIDNPDNDLTYINFKIDGLQVNMPEPATITSMMASISATEDTGSDIRVIILTIPVGATVGTHAITDASSSDLNAYSAQYAFGDVSFSATSGSLNITSIGAEYMEGTFTFSGEFDGNTYNVTNGVLRAYKPNDN